MKNNTDKHFNGRNGYRNGRQRRSARRRGSVVVMVSLAFVALCGFCALATDYGQLVWQRNQLQRACDAAAIGGASQLPYGANAQQVATTIAAQNAVNNPTFAWPNGVKQIRVSAARQVKFGFAPVLGINSGNVTATAVAGRIPLNGVGGNVPLAITMGDYTKYKDGNSFEQVLIDNNRQDFKNGTLTALDLRPDGSGKSGAVFETDLLNGYAGTIYFDQKISNSLNASLSSQGPKLISAMEQRFLDAAQASYADTGTNYTYPDYPANDRRIVTLIVADENPLSNNNPMLTARLIVPVYLETVRTTGGSYRLKMRILPAKSYTTDDANISLGNDNTPESGLFAVRLLS